MKKLLAILLTLVLLLPVAAEDTLVEWIPFDDEGTLFLRYDTYRDYYVLTDRDGKRVEVDSFYAFQDWTYENIFVVAREGKYGYFDKDSGWIVQPQFDFAHYFQDNGLAAVKKDGLWGFIDREGEVVFEPQFDAYEEDEYLYSEDYEFYDHIAAVCKNGLWGYVWDDGTVLMEPQFDDAGYFGYGKGLTWVKKDGLYGIVNSSGELLFAPQFDEVKMWNIDSGIVPVMKDGLWGYITLEGKWLFEPQFAYADYFDDRFGVAVVKQAGPIGWQGLVSRDGEVLIEPRFSVINGFNENGIARVAISGRWGFIRADGSVIAEPQFDRSWHDFSEGACAVKKDGLYGFIDENGDWLIEPSYADAGDFHEGLADVQDSSGLWGYIDKQGKYVIEPQYYSVWSFENGIAHVDAANYDACGLIDREGNVLLDTVNQWIGRTDDGVYEVDTGNGWKNYALIGGVFQEISTVSNELYLRDYYPNEGEKVAVLSEKADIIWDESAALPRLDGAKALVPVYAAFVQATYPEDTRLKDTDYSWIVPETQVAYTNTVSAYERLMHGETDMIFCAGPSQAEVEDAAKLGVEFELTCMGYEAFVFIVNADNPPENISVDQIRGIYSGEITSWDALGVEGIGDIIAYQRNKNSGSQTTLEKLMGDTPLMEAPSIYVSDGMEDILTTIEYRNFPNAISFTFRFFCKDMIGSSVKMLAIDGVAPTEENIRNGSYPLITPVYAVTRKGETNPNVQILLDWITGSQGQELVEKSGYVGVN